MVPEAKRKRVVSGMRPTGRLHIGHYFGALQNWIRLQNDPEYECFYFIADWHALTSDYADTSAVAQNVIEIMTDYLAAGLDPQKSVIFQQSQIPEHAELHLLLSMVTPLGWLERVPTYKEALENVKDKDLHTYGFLGYPVLQCADIVIYSQKDTQLFVPVGEDQVSHVEASREIVRKFNTNFGFKISSEFYGEANTASLATLLNVLLERPSAPLDYPLAIVEQMIRHEVLTSGFQNFVNKVPMHQRSWFTFERVLTEPEHMLTNTPRIPGTDGRKMSKSYRNDISLLQSFNLTIV